MEISKEFLPKLFDPFAQEDNIDRRNYKGTGLGLALVKKYAEINNAKIGVSSKIKVLYLQLFLNPPGNNFIEHSWLPQSRVVPFYILI